MMVGVLSSLGSPASCFHVADITISDYGGELFQKSLQTSNDIEGILKQSLGLVPGTCVLHEKAWA
jgi:hypothetical protein